MLWRVLIASIFMAAFVRNAEAQQTLNESEIRDLLVGKSALFADNGLASYASSGAYSYVYPNNYVVSGKYNISGSKMCAQYSNGGSRCDTVARDATGPYMIGNDGARYRFVVLSTIATRSNETFCGVPVSYTFIVPQPTVPENMKAFAGAWVGKWDYGACAALVVESIRDDGLASLIVVKGEFGGEYAAKSELKRITGVVVGNTLKSEAGVNYLHYTRSGDALVALSGGTGAVVSGRLTRPKH